MKKINKDFIISSTMELCGLVLSILCAVFFFVGQTMLTYLFGAFGILFIIAFVLFSLVSVQNKRLYDYFAIGFDFFVSVVVCAFMIATIKDDKIQTIVLSLAAAIYGGLLTLIGVAWTIKKSDRDRKEDEEKKAIPLFSFNMLYEPPIGEIIKKVCFPKSLEIQYTDEIYVELENSDRSVVVLDRVFHDGTWFQLQGNTVMLPNKTYFLSFKYNSPNDIYLIVKDSFDKEYAYHIRVLRIKMMADSGKYFNTVREINKIELKEMYSIINKK